MVDLSIVMLVTGADSWHLCDTRRLEPYKRIHHTVLLFQQLLRFHSILIIFQCNAISHYFQDVATKILKQQ